MSEVMRRGKYTLEFKQEGVRQVLAGQSASAVARSLGIPKASLSNWVRQEARGELSVGMGKEKGPASVTPEQMEIARLRAENMRLKMERDIAKKAAVGSMDHCNTFLLSLHDGGLINGTNGTAWAHIRRQG